MISGNDFYLITVNGEQNGSLDFFTYYRAFMLEFYSQQE